MEPLFPVVSKPLVSGDDIMECVASHALLACRPISAFSTINVHVLFRE